MLRRGIVAGPCMPEVMWQEARVTAREGGGWMVRNVDQD